MAIPPNSVSPEAAAFMERAFGRPAYPAPNDTEGWRTFIREQNAAVLPGYVAAAHHSGVRTAVQREAVGAAQLYSATPEDAEHPRRTVIYLHMGGLALYGGEIVLYMAVIHAGRFRLKVHAVDFRTPPDHPYPAALDDCMAAYRFVLGRHAPGEIAIQGDSGGANLAAAMCLRMVDEGLPLPASLVLRWPQVDLTESGDTFVTNRDNDFVMGGGTPELNALYLNGHYPTDPYVSPLFGDFSKGFPPTMLLSGTRDCFLSNAARMHRALRRCGIEADLHVFEAMPHGGLGSGSLENQEARQEARRFIARHWR